MSKRDEQVDDAPDDAQPPTPVRQEMSGGREWWTDALAETYCEMDPQWESPRGRFEARLSTRQFGDLSLSTVRAHAHSVLRTPAMIADTDSEDYFLCAVTGGPGRIEQHGRSIWLDKGSFAVIDAGLPFRFDFPQQFEQIVVRVPRPLLLGRMSERDVDRVMAQPVSAVSGAGVVVSRFLQQIAALDAAVPNASATALSASAMDMIVTALADTGGAVSPTQQAHTVDLHRAQNLLKTRLHDENLSITEAAAELGISLRYLQKIFQSTGSTPSEWLLQARLERARMILLSTEITIGELASRVGFKDTSHFSRSFRNRYGISPGQYRQR
ncbi:helix-turn-helix domain-containing protein [Rhodococcus pseudokoreensis]|uniref:Helix-turn-helix domain-containing protein n=1 Tax=Rhodococcus pseudokoreensis TaxID=2811421 RepID=A0A974ZT11_9NOCA|nr:helix-turn-helix domain-containing protein [Rhodococcus pseudokoreensis]QSE89396.1 helix-turn-helix domain-containing protein [Rhodococcus pseudokoreensis]